jgi:gamma-glutamyl-gamma-aminobutyrate hydrolase PuuD
MSVEHPLIGISGRRLAQDSPEVRLPLSYCSAVQRAGGVAVILPPSGGPSDVARALEQLDGLLLPGGDDFNTELLGLGPTHAQARPVTREQQDFDVELARAALRMDLPVLGICYGMQLLALVSGGGLYQHLPEDRPGARDHSGGVHHAVRIQPGSKLAGALGVERLDVISRHHQAISRVGDDWIVSAMDDEDLIEAAEHRTHTFALGVQWHPELAGEGSAHDRLFRALVGSGGVRAGRRTFGGLAAKA